MANEVQTQVFDYTELDATTADFLRAKETNMREIVGKAYTDLGRELKEAQDALASRDKYKGVFNAWLDYMQYARRTAYELIDRYNELVRIPHNMQDTFEALPISLSKAVSAKSAESTEAKAQAKTEVLDGSIETLKQYRERIAELEAQALQADSARRQAEQRELDAKRSAEIANRQNERLTDELATATKPETVVVEKEVERIVEVDRTDYTVAERLQQYEARFGALENYTDRIRGTNLADVTTSVMTFSKAVRDLTKRHAYLAQYQDTLGALDDITKQQYDEAIEALRGFTDLFSPRQSKYGGVVDAVIINQ